MSFVVAIDGPSGAGKSTVAKMLAGRLNLVYVDTGAMYRAAALKALRNEIELGDDSGLKRLMESTEIFFSENGANRSVLLDNVDVSDEIRTPEISMAASDYSKSPAVRQRLVELQREMGSRENIIMEGRDIGTVVFPDANVKFYLDASGDERAKRRFIELKGKGKDVDQAQTKLEMEQRDKQDSGRKLAPLKAAEDAIRVDTTKMSLDEVVDTLEKTIRERLNINN